MAFIGTDFPEPGLRVPLAPNFDGWAFLTAKIRITCGMPVARPLYFILPERQNSLQMGQIQMGEAAILAAKFRIID
jgi:hypothetical protein